MIKGENKFSHKLTEEAMSVETSDEVFSPRSHFYNLLFSRRRIVANLLQNSSCMEGKVLSAQ